MFGLGYDLQNFRLLFWFIFPAKIADSVKFVCSCVCSSLVVVNLQHIMVLKF